MDCDGSLVVATDARARQAFWRRVAIRKQYGRQREAVMTPRSRSRGTVLPIVLLLTSMMLVTAGAWLE